MFLYCIFCRVKLFLFSNIVVDDYFYIVYLSCFGFVFKISLKLEDSKFFLFELCDDFIYL